MEIYNINMINYFEFISNVLNQFDLFNQYNIDDGKLSFGFDNWEYGIREIYFGEDIDLDDPEWENDPLGKCMITYLRDLFPHDEVIYINFGA